MKRRILSLIAALALIVSIPAPSFALEDGAEPAAERQTIVIENLEQFLDFARNCTLDAWSQDKDVVLKADISLEGVAFDGIPTFGGSFDGGGHTISGFCVTQSVAPVGLFRYVQPTAVVKHLTVSGSVVPDGDGAIVGGIAGENWGVLEDCSFSGEVKGHRDTGGIAGANYGTLRRCETRGAVTGENRTGGVAGYNLGILDGCKNEMDINTECVDPKIDPTAIDLSFQLDMTQLSNIDTSDAASDTGGIVGYSAGTVANCTNTGAVGYPHIGYNLGGIAGRNSGFVSACTNAGHIQGRKDVGGIVGQIEPEIAVILSPDYLETLSKQFQNLANLVGAAGSHAASTGENVRSCIQTLVAYQSSAQSAISSLASGLGSDIESGNLGESLDTEALWSLGSAIQGMASTTNTLQGIIGGSIEDVSDDVNAISWQLNSISRTFSMITEEAQQETVTDISEADLSDITDGLVLLCTNRGTVEADLNVGGIAGCMGIESDTDPEDDAPSGNITQRRRYELKAIVQDCVSTGTVTGKRSYAGGICGRMELGLITSSKGYGTITSENGDYVGGIAGMTGGAIRNCFAKCTLAGGSYIGGIVGCGIQEDYSGESSTVADCRSMVRIERSEQYVGGIAGAYIGDYTGNVFVSDTLQGINGVSYFALAEPISYRTLQKMEDLPAELRRLTLSFEAEGETIKTLTFDYGDSFDYAIFPDIPQKEGYYAQWSTTELTDLRFDTVVKAEYFPQITALSSEAVRSDGRPVLFVQGRFQEGDTLSVLPGTTEFPLEEKQTLLEQWFISVPADGAESHSIRYLPTEERAKVYLLKNGSWVPVPTELMGSYLHFEASGADVEIAAVSEDDYEKWIIPAAALAAVLLVGIVFLVRKRQKGGRAKESAAGDSSAAAKQPKSRKTKRRWVLLIALLIAAGAAATVMLFLPQTKAGQSLRAYDVLKTYLEQPEQKMRLTVKAQIANRNGDFSADIGMTTAADTTVTVISESGRELYFANGMVFLDSGDAFLINSTAPDYFELMEQLLGVYDLVQIEAVEGVYTATAEGEQAAAMVKLLIPSALSLLPEDSRLTVDLITQEDALTQIRFTGAGNLTDSVKTPFSVSATVDVLPVNDSISIPDTVKRAIAKGGAQPKELYSDDLIRLIEAWEALRSQNPITAQILLEADCGPLTVGDTLRYTRWETGSSTIHGIESDERQLFFTENAVCDAEGRGLPAGSSGEPDAAALLDAVYQNFRSAEFQCRQEEAAGIYTVSLSQSGMKQLAEVLVPQTRELDISYSKGSIQLRVEDGVLQSVSIVCGGSVKVLAVRPEAEITAEIRFQEQAAAAALPEAVKETLLK